MFSPKPIFHDLNFFWRIYFFVHFFLFCERNEKKCKKIDPPEKDLGLEKIGTIGVGKTQFSDNVFLFFYKNFTCYYFWSEYNENEVEKVFIKIYFLFFYLMKKIKNIFL